jgi:hypothetical protein
LGFERQRVCGAGFSRVTSPAEAGTTNRFPETAPGLVGFAALEAHLRKLTMSSTPTKALLDVNGIIASVID